MERTRVHAHIVRLVMAAVITATAIISSMSLTIQGARAATSNAPVAGIARTWDGKGYWEVANDGGIFSFGDAAFYGSMGGQPLSAPVVGITATPKSNGYWEVASDGGIFTFGSAAFYGSMGGQPLNAPVVAVTATPTGKGYWEVASDGGIFAFGDAGFFGSMGGQPLNQPMVGVTATPTGKGYWEVARDGGIFAFGDAGFFGSMGGQPLNAPVVAITATPTGNGYWEVSSDGGIFAFGDAGFFGSMGGQPLNGPMVGVAATPTGKGYWEVASDGGIFAFGDAGFFGSAVVPPPPLASAQDLAKQILANSRINKSGRLVLTDLQDAAAGRPATAGYPLSATLLRLIVALGQNHSLVITALESGGTGHSTNSYHYTGDAVDFGSLDGQVVTGRNTPSLVIIRQVAGLMPSGSAFGQSNCGPTPPLPVGVSTFQDTCNHLHVQVTRNAP